jgi:tetratricopeptide (TPR) repeat protein
MIRTSQALAPAKKEDVTNMFRANSVTCRVMLNWLIGVLAAVVVPIEVAASQAPDGKGPTPADRFVATLDERSALPADARALIQKTWAECDDCDGEEFLIQGLTLLSPKFRDALDALDADEFGRAIAQLAELSDHPDPFISTNAAAYEIKALVHNEQLVETHQRIEDLLSDDAERLATYTYMAPEIEFLRGYCLLADVRYGEAMAALESFLAKYPDASQRLVISAGQMLLELKNRQPEKLGDVVDLMNYCGRRLRIADAGQTVRKRQDRIVELLDQMIEEAEQDEQMSESSGSQGSSSGRQGSQRPSKPMEDSVLPGGTPSDGPGLRESRRANPGEMWGAMPPAERERVLQALRESFPLRYRRLVEQYYEELAKKP